MTMDKSFKIRVDKDNVQQVHKFACAKWFYAPLLSTLQFDTWEHVHDWRCWQKMSTASL